MFFLGEAFDFINEMTWLENPWASFSSSFLILALFYKALENMMLLKGMLMAFKDRVLAYANFRGSLRK